MCQAESYLGSTRLYINVPLTSGSSVGRPAAVLYHRVDQGSKGLVHTLRQDSAGEGAINKEFWKDQISWIATIKATTPRYLYLFYLDYHANYLCQLILLDLLATETMVMTTCRVL